MKTTILHIFSEDDMNDYAGTSFINSDYSIMDIIGHLQDKDVCPDGVFNHSDEVHGDFDAELIEIPNMETTAESFTTLYNLLFEDEDVKKRHDFYWVGCEK